ncbi:S53 family peptidase [Streptacidiphilus fuscans]|uniref:S8/S53 family peptidase n=1 Tax=Streptacidiphilus fuscans TaxID=2789292 RepID=A0A931AZ47_9ACTN|nr:S8/S53 family peptidase [Streptacidiphilus fuscans]MBF9068114.1 S8/S53 family peptidase [Streptacidiphilus fuscans]
MARKIGRARITTDSVVAGKNGRFSGSRARAAGVAVVTAFGVVTALAGTADAATATADNAAQKAPVRIGATPRVPAGAVRTGTTPSSSTTLHLAVNLQPRDPSALSAFVSAVSDKSSPLYHHYLGTGQFAQDFGPTQSTIDAVEQALRSQGLTPGTVSQDGLSIPVTASIATASNALSTSFTNVKLANGSSAYLNTAAPVLPSSVAAQVSSISGLTDVSSVTSHFTKPRLVGSAPTSGSTGVAPHAATATSPTVCSGLTSNLQKIGLNDTKQYYSPSSLASAYGLGKSFTAGAGVKVGVFELENVNTSDIADYQSCLGTHTSVSFVSVDGGPTVAPNADNGVGIEAGLDIDDLIGLVPGASIIDYQGPDAQNATDQNVLDVYQKMVTDNQVKVISTSWGVCEAPVISSDPGFFASQHNIFAEAAAQGQSLVAAAGDGGSTDCYRQAGDSNALAVDNPASDPYVTGVGGTWMNGLGSTLKQAVWNYNGTVNAPGAGGGGVSTEWNSGSSSANGSFLYQSGFTGPGYSNACNAASGETCRQVPDVSALADQGSGYLVSLDHNGSSDAWYVIGGTSGATPTWAAMLAQADASSGCKANGPVGQVNPIVYAAARSTYSSSFTDITAGNNDWTVSGYKGGNYAASTGYDLASGLGTPKFPGLLGALCGTKTGTAHGDFFPVSPTRILDTRDGTGGFKTPLGANATDSLQVAGVAGVPNDGSVTAVMLSVTAVGPTASSFLSVYGDGTGNGSTTLAYTPGQIVPNSVVVPVKDGKVDFYNHSGSVNVVAVVSGYYGTAATNGSTFVGISPAHLLDTRSGTGTGGTIAPLGANATITVPTTGQAGVPNDGTVTAVALDVTAIAGTANSYIGVYPGTSGPSTASSLSFAPGQIIANTIIVPVGTDGTVKFYNHSGSVNVTADVTGYYTTATTGSGFSAVVPSHLLDTRNAAKGFTALGSGGTLSFPVTGVGGVATNANAVVLNVTAIGGTANSYLSIYPDSLGHSASTSIDFSTGQTISSLVIVPVIDGKIAIYNHAGAVNVAADVLGYYAP